MLTDQAFRSRPQIWLGVETFFNAYNLAHEFCIAIREYGFLWDNYEVCLIYTSLQKDQADMLSDRFNFYTVLELPAEHITPEDHRLYRFITRIAFFLYSPAVVALYRQRNAAVVEASVSAEAIRERLLTLHQVSFS